MKKQNTFSMITFFFKWQPEFEVSVTRFYIKRV